MENSFIFKMKPGQFVYKQDAEVTPNIFFVLFGSFVCSKQQIGDFGSIMCVGHTFGEEILFSGDKDYLKRKESIVCKDQACVLQITASTLFAMQNPGRVALGGGHNHLNDFESIIYILECHFAQKNEWRNLVSQKILQTGENPNEDLITNLHQSKSTRPKFS